MLVIAITLPYLPKFETDETENKKPALAGFCVINGKIRELNTTLKNLPEIQRQYLQLSREVEVKQQLYTNLVNSYQQLRIAKAGEIGNVHVIDTALEPIDVIKQKQPLILFLTFCFGTFLNSGGIIPQYVPFWSER